VTASKVHAEKKIGPWLHKIITSTVAKGKGQGREIEMNRTPRTSEAAVNIIQVR
jgi:hypothetical protein